jgi:tetratricopeptide (TPR) repeat protein
MQERTSNRLLQPSHKEELVLRAPTLKEELHGKHIRNSFLRNGKAYMLTKQLSAMDHSTLIDQSDGRIHPGMLSSQSMSRYERTGAMYDLEEAIATSREALECAAEDHPSRTTYLSALSGQLASRYERTGAMYDLEEAIATSREALECAAEDHPSRTTYLSGLGLLYTLQESYGMAEKSFEQAIAICDNNLGPGYNLTLQAVNNLGKLQIHQGKHAEANRTYRRALDQCEQVLGSEHASVSFLLANMAALCVSESKYAEAEELFKRSLEGYERLHGTNDQWTYGIVSDLGNLYNIQGRFAEAKEMYERASDVYRKTFHLERENALDMGDNFRFEVQAQDNVEEVDSVNAHMLRSRTISPEPIDTPAFHTPDVQYGRSRSGLKQLYHLASAEQAAFDAHQRRNDPLCLPDTRTEILEQIRVWAYDETDRKCIFWLSGMAGTGKSTIARTVARRFFDEGRLGASFFFSRDVADIDDGKLFIGTIAKQLATSTRLALSGRQDLQYSICKAVSGCSDLAGMSWREQWESFIIHPIEQLKCRPQFSAFFERVFRHNLAPQTLVIVIDALDECKHEIDLRRILQLLARTAESTTYRLRIFITSRPETPILLGFRAMPNSAFHQLVLEDVAKNIIDHDIRAFLKSELDEIKHASNTLPAWPGDETVDLLVKRAAGHFLFAATACSILGQDQTTLKERLLAAAKPLDTSQRYPDALDQTYIEVLRHFVPLTYNENERRELYELFELIIKPVVLLVEALSVDSINSLIQTERSEVIKALGRLRSVIHWPEKEGSKIKLLHSSFREFLIDPRRCTDISFRIDEGHMHYVLFSHCLRVMSAALNQYVCGFQHPGTEAAACSIKRLNQYLPSHLQYACCHWITHLLRSEDLVREESSVISFFERHSLHWLEALCWMGRIAEAIKSVKELEDSIVSTNYSETTCTLLIRIR